MSIVNKYFIIPVADLTEAREALIVGDEAIQRKNVAETNHVVKLPVETQVTPDEFTGYTEYDHGEICVEMLKAAWQE